MPPRKPTSSGQLAQAGSTTCRGKLAVQQPDLGWGAGGSQAGVHAPVSGRVAEMRKRLLFSSLVTLLRPQLAAMDTALEENAVWKLLRGPT